MRPSGLGHVARRVLGALRLRPRPRLSLELVEPPQLGGRLLVRVRTDAPVAVTPRDARVVLRRTVREVIDGDPLVVRSTAASTTLHPIGRLGAGTYHEELASLPIPPDAPPSGVARRTRVSYRLQARLRCVDAPTRRSRLAITVLSPRAANRGTEAQGIVSAARRPLLDLRLGRRHARPGERLDGQVRVTESDARPPAPISIELRRREEAISGNPREWIVERHLVPVDGEARSSTWIPFELPIPRGISPTMVLRRTAVRWRVCAVTRGAAGGRDSVALEINVYNGD